MTGSVRFFSPNFKNGFHNVKAVQDFVNDALLDMRRRFIHVDLNWEEIGY